MNNHTPLITVAINYYNDKKYLSDCIESVLNQSFSDFQLVLFNHASTDGSRDIARSYDDPRIIHVDADKNLGAPASYNLRYSFPFLNGKFYKGFSADDVMKTDCLKHLVEYVESNPSADLIFGNLEYVNDKGKSLGRDWFHSHKKFSTDCTELDLIRVFAAGENILPCPASLIRMEKLKRIKWDNSLTIRADMWFWLSLLIGGSKVGFCDKIVGSYRVHEYQESYFDAEILRNRSEMEKIPFLSLFFEVQDVNTVKAVFPDSPYASKLTETRDVPFYIAEYFLRKNGYPFAYQALFNMMQDEENLQRLERVFGFGVLELRRLYAFKKSDGWKKKVFAKNPKKLNEAELLYLLSRRFLKTLTSIITLRPLRRKF